MPACRYPVIDLPATGENITRLRLSRGLTVRDLQHFFGFDAPQAIYKWQRGQALPSVDNLFALSALLGVPIDDILVGSGTDYQQHKTEPNRNQHCRQPVKPVHLLNVAIPDQTGTQFYSGNFIGDQKGKGGFDYHFRSGMCLEPQYIPNAMNFIPEGDVNSPIFDADEHYHAESIYKFSVK